MKTGSELESRRRGRQVDGSIDQDLQLALKTFSDLMAVLFCATLFTPTSSFHWLEHLKVGIWRPPSRSAAAPVTPGTGPHNAASVGDGRAGATCNRTSFILENSLSAGSIMAGLPSWRNSKSAVRSLPGRTTPSEAGGTKGVAAASAPGVTRGKGNCGRIIFIVGEFAAEGDLRLSQPQEMVVMAEEGVRSRKVSTATRPVFVHEGGGQLRPLISACILLGVVVAARPSPLLVRFP